MNKFTFQTDAEADAYCQEIIDEMIGMFNISEKEAVDILNRQWKGQSLLKDSMLFHETPRTWARNIYGMVIEGKEWWDYYKNQNEK